MIKVKFINLACLPNLNARLIFMVFLILVLSAVFIIEQISAQDNKTCTTDLKGDMEFLIATSKLHLTDSLLNHVHKESHFSNTVIGYNNLNNLDSLSKYLLQYYSYSPVDFWNKFCKVDSPKYFKEILKSDENGSWETRCKQVERAFDSSLIKKIQDIAIDDQRFRTEITQISNINQNGNSNHLKDLMQKQSHLDSINMHMIDSITFCCGFPGRRKLGIDNQLIPFLIIQHASIEKMQYYLPILKNAIKLNDLSADVEGYLTDRILLATNKKQKYGTQFYFNAKRNKMEIYPIEDMKNVDKRRSEIGLYPLKKDLRTYGIKLN